MLPFLFEAFPLGLEFSLRFCLLSQFCFAFFFQLFFQLLCFEMVDCELQFSSAEFHVVWLDPHAGDSALSFNNFSGLEDFREACFVVSSACRFDD